MRRVVAVVVVLVVAYAWLSGGFALLLPTVAPARCSVGLNGAAVSVTVQGPGAMGACEEFLTQTTDGGTWYVYASGEQPTAPLVCQVALSGDVVDVRDSGLLDAYGTSICNNLFKQATAQQQNRGTTP